MRKLLSGTIITIAFCAIITGCGSQPKEAASQQESTTTAVEEATQVVQESTGSTTKSIDESRFDGSQYKDMGSGTIYLVNESGSTENGDDIIVYAGKDDWAISMELDAWEFDGKILSYIYIDGTLVDKQQLADTQMTLMLSEDSLAPGPHKVEVVQYENNDEGGNVITYKSSGYEVVAK